MKEIYSWVPWFQKLAEKIAKEGEVYLSEKAKDVSWGEDPPLLRYGDDGIDPFSFFYFLASKNTKNQRQRVYDSVSDEFGIERLPDIGKDRRYIFPTPQSNAHLLFHERENFTPDLFWRLFRAVQDNTKIDPDDFKNALEIKYTGVPKLTQTLFLINPEYFLPADDTTFHLSEALGLPEWRKIEKEIMKDGGYEKYLSVLKKIKKAFPGCQPYEINMFLDRQKSGQITVSNNFFQISTNAYGDNKGDYWDKIDDNFKDNNWVYTGGGGGKRKYPLNVPMKGDIILVRTRRQIGRAIGIVYENDYGKLGGWDKNSRIHVLWINKAKEQLSGFTDMQGFNEAKAGSTTRSVFEEAGSYTTSFGLINSLIGNSDKSDRDGQKLRADTMKHPLNQILYGPPGTGKTWNTVNRAVAIVDGKSGNDLKEEICKINEGKSLADFEREKIKERFDKLKEDGRIAMVTFHQNFTYEDFIEGIRPVLAGKGSEEDEGSKNIEYKLHEGVFKKISDRADENRTQSEQTDNKSWDMDALLEAFAKSIEERLESGEEINLFPPDHRSGAIIKQINWSKDDKFQSFKLDGSGRLAEKVIKRDYEAFCEGKIKSRTDIRPTRRSKQTEHERARYLFQLYHRIKQFHDEWQQEESIPVEKQNYVLIIDEINRGNIAKIFAELITLIEPSKRIGSKKDETTVTLPYSQKEFGVPNNLYIIGTMNTADRSIAPLDTALRRRFEFVEMMPDIEHHKISTNIEGVNCQELLAAMNKRIRFLFDREHQIGHTYFMDVDDMKSLAATFKNKIIPLLQEYFYDNWEKIDLVLNCNGFIDPQPSIDSNLFKNSELIDQERKIYELLSFNSRKWEDPKNYQAIYAQGQSETGEAG